MPQDDVKAQELFELLDKMSSVNGIIHSMSQTQLDGILDELKKFRIRVLLARNAKAAINIVAKDIVYRIFTVCVLTSKDPVRQALDISHVCHHWRQSALGWPALWTTVDLRYRNLLELCLERNGMAPIDLIVSDKRRSPFSKLSSEIPDWSRQNLLIPLLIPRLRSLTLHIDDHSHCEDVLRHFRSIPVVNLQKLDICMPGLKNGPIAVLDLFLSAENSPWSLVLNRVVFKWNNPLIRSLTRLSLLAPPVSPTFGEFMILLSASPDLEFLELKWIYSPAYNQTINDNTADDFHGPVLDMLRLKKLIIVLATPICRSFSKRLLDRVYVPSLKSIYIDSPYFDSSSAGNPPLTLLPSNPPYPFDVLKHIHLTRMQGHPEKCVLKGRRVLNGLSMGYRDESDMDFFVKCSIPNTAGSRKIESLLGILRSMRGVEHLELYTDAWQFLLGGSGIDLLTVMPKLLILELSGEYTTTNNASELWDRLILPENLSLTTLCLRHLRCNNEALMDLVVNTRIRTIHLDHCEGVDARGIAELRENGVLVRTSEEMSAESMISIWGESCQTVTSQRVALPRILRED